MEGRTMKTTTKQKPPADGYFEMIHRFPLRPIRNESECQRATDILDEYFPREDLDDGTQDYVVVLAGLVADFEDKHHAINTAGITPLKLLKHRMEESQMSTADLGRLIGNSGLASMIVHGKRDISKANAKLLGKRFGLNPRVFI